VGAIARFLRRHWRVVVHEDDAQDSFEYLLVVGGVLLVVMFGFIALDTVVVQLLGASCPSVDTAKGVAATAGSCIK
jgi:hypothetical protein